MNELLPMNEIGEKKKAARPPVRRWLRGALTVVPALALLMVACLWLWNRMSYVVSRHAFVRGELVQLGSPLDGQVVEVRVGPGSVFQEGDVLVRLDDSAQRARVAAARAALERAQLDLLTERQTVQVDDKRLGAVEARLRASLALGRAEERAAQIEARFARRNANRVSLLVSNALAPGAEGDNAAAEAALATERFLGARHRSAFLRAEAAVAAVEREALGARRERLEILEAGLDSPRAVLSAAEGELRLTVLRAPKDGRVLGRLVGPGAAVRVGGPVMELQLGDELFIEAWLPESDFSRARPGGEAEVRFEAFGRERFSARIQSVSVLSEFEVKTPSATPAADDIFSKRWVVARLLLLRQDPRLATGLTATVEIPR